MGEGKIVGNEKSIENTWFAHTKQASNIYEGSDSEDERTMTTRGHVAQMSRGEAVNVVRCENGTCSSLSNHFLFLFPTC